MKKIEYVDPFTGVGGMNAAGGYLDEVYGIFARGEDHREAWRLWEVASCVERGGHWWRLTCHHPDDGAGVTVTCDHCPAQVGLDVFPYGEDMSGSWGGVEIEYGKHNSPIAVCVPVDVDVVSGSYMTDYGTEWDAELSIEPHADMFTPCTCEDV